MQFFLQSSLHYEVTSEATLFCSLRCIPTETQQLRDEILSTDRPARQTELQVGLAENRLNRVEVDSPGPFTVSYEATADIRPSIIKKQSLFDDGIRGLSSVEIPYLLPSRYAPADRLRAVANQLFGSFATKMEQAVAVEDWLFENIAYIPGASQEQSWAPDTYEARSGVCRDFAHLGIAFCRALCIPARYVTVYAHQLIPQDFHAVFEVFIGGQWFVFDGTRKAPLNGLVRIASGRDASDAAIATLFGNIQGTGIQVSSLLGKDETEVFRPLYRDQLEANSQAIALD
ncbi:MAG: transglutaminase family protein [Verrucomicrobiota bacterium]